MIKQIARWILKDEINELSSEISKLKTQIPIIKPLEYYYNNKYPKENIVYNRIDNNKVIKIDVRQFINKNNYLLPKFSGSDDEKALLCLKWIINNIEYISDKTEYGLNEYWAFGYQTLNVKKGDCEDGAILLYDLMSYNGIPDWKIRISAGYVKTPTGQEGHAYLNYFCEETNKWVTLDWCYYPNKTQINKRIDYKEDENYLNVWFSFNSLYSWTKGLNTDARNILK